MEELKQKVNMLSADVEHLKENQTDMRHCISKLTDLTEAAEDREIRRVAVEETKIELAKKTCEAKSRRFAKIKWITSVILGLGGLIVAYIATT